VDPVEPIINLEETIGKTVGRRRPTTDFAKAAVDIQNASIGFHKVFKAPFFPKGVYRFKTHEEADAWHWKMLTRKKK
jgi:hypothetical protein